MKGGLHLNKEEVANIFRSCLLEEADICKKWSAFSIKVGLC